MEHYLLIVEVCVDGLCACLAMGNIQATPEPGEERRGDIREMKRNRVRGNKIKKDEHKGSGSGE